MFCSKCGGQLSQGVAFCSNCGNPAVTPAASVYVPAPDYSAGPSQGQFQQQNYAQLPSASGLAVAAFVVSLFLPFIGLFMGYAARNEIRSSNGTKGGNGFASAAIAIGWIFTILGIILIAVYVAYFASLSSDLYY